MTVKHITKDGREMLISEMDDDHLLNTIRLLERRAKDGVVFRTGDCGVGYEDCYYEEDLYYGKAALYRLNYSFYVEEANKRGITNVL